MLATAEHATDIDRTASELPAGTPIIALIESALGVHNAIEIASAIGTFRIAFGQAIIAAIPVPATPPWRSPMCARNS